MNTKDFLLEALFRTNALQVCPPNQPFWYTSGKIGPYYINTHFLFGGQQKADNFLNHIETAVENTADFYRMLKPKAEAIYKTDSTYRQVIDNICRKIKDLEFDLISGGERRDFFFSLAVAQKMELPHLAILKTGQAYLAEADSRQALPAEVGRLRGQRVLHIADLVTAASSYERTWLPAIARTGATIEDTLAIVDRRQGGAAVLRQNNVNLHSLCRIEGEFFSRAYEQGLIDDRQLAMLRDFIQDPDLFMQRFLQANPDYINQQLAKGGKNALRARRYLEQSLADLNAGDERS